MKKYSQTLLFCAREDLAVAEKILSDSPNLAAFHAQQCVEKALKSLAYEYGDYKDEDEFGRKIGHDSIEAVMSGMRNILDQIHGKMDSEIKKNLDSQGQEWYMRFITPIRKELSDLFKLSPIAKDYEKYWNEGLNLNLEPEPLVSKAWSEKSASHWQSIDREWRKIMRQVGIGIPEVVNLFNPNQNILEKIKNLDTIIKKLRSAGQHQLADGLEKVKSLIGPNLELVQLIRLTITWGPYLDAHAVRSRYPSSEDLEKYHNSIPAIENLVEKAKEILEATEKVTNVLSEFF